MTDLLCKICAICSCRLSILGWRCAKRTFYIKSRNSYAISWFENPYWVWFSIHKSV